MKVVNECRIVFKYQMSPGSTIIGKTIISNMVSTQILNDVLCVKNYAGKEETCRFDIITYTVVIKNISSDIITNIYFSSILPEKLMFIRNSIKINGVRRNYIDVEDGFDIGDLQAGGQITVEYKALVLQCNCEDIKNYSKIDYDYIYNVEEDSRRVSIYSNVVIAQCINKLFKQISVSDNFKIYGCIKNITYISYKVEIVKTKVLDITFKNLCTVLVIGKIKFRVWFESGFSEECIENESGFVETIMVPEGIYYLPEENIKVCVENMSAKLINRETIFISADLLLHY